MNLAFYKKNFTYLVLLLLPLIVYFITYPRTVGLVDSGLMATGAVDFGAPLPTGYPIFIIISHIFTFIPFGTITDRLYLTSYLSATLLLLLLFYTIKRFILLGKKSLVEISSLIACLSLAFSYQYWVSAINIETFILTNLFIFLILGIVFKINDLLSVDGVSGKEVKKYVLLFFLVLGIAAGLSPIAIISIPAILIFLFVNWKKIVSNKVVYLEGLAISFIIFVLEYGVLMASASSHPFINFGEPSSIGNLIKLMTGGGFLSYPTKESSNVISVNGFYFGAQIIWESFSEYTRMFLFEFNPLFIPLIIYGAYKLYANRFIFFSLLSMLLLDMFFSVFYISGNQENWALASWIIAAIFLSVGIYYFLEKLLTYKPIDDFSNRYHPYFYLILFFIAILPLFVWFNELNRSQLSFTNDYIINMYKDVKKNSIVIGGGNVFEAQTDYAREVLGYRKDIIPLAGNFFYDFLWYRDNITKSTGIKVSNATDNLVLKYPKNNQGTIILSLISDNPSRNFYMTSSYLRSYLNDVNTSCAKGICTMEGYVLIPQGLLFKIVPAQTYQTVNPDDWNFVFTNGLPTKYFVLEQYYKQEQGLMVDEYMESYVNLGDYYSTKKDLVSALKYYKKALSLDTDQSVDPYIRLAITYQNMNNPYLATMYYEQSMNILPDNLDLRNNYYNLLNAMQPVASASAAASSPKQTQTQQTQVQAQNKQYVSPSLGLSFIYLGTWGVTEDSGIITVANQADNFIVTIKVSPYNFTNVNDFLATRTDTYGQLLQQGKALIPGYKDAFVRIWQQDNVKKDQFFLPTGNKVIELLVYPSDSNLMQDFNIILGTIKLK